jgi:glyoxylase-like metal-dependent hydrolase (beta-lactamase superfamily II)
MLSVKKFTFNPLGENTYVVYDQRRQCAIIDPGCCSPQEQNILANYIEQEALTPVLLLNTHCHVDHVPGNAFVASTYQIPLMIHERELPLLRDAPQFGRFFGLHCPPSPEPTAFLQEGDEVNIGSGKLQVLFTPGHSPGSISFYCKEASWIIVGDVLFLGSVGRFDLPGADGETLFQSIEHRLLCLPDHTKVYCGHGPDTTIGHERTTNPFLNKNFREIY